MISNYLQNRSAATRQNINACLIAIAVAVIICSCTQERYLYAPGKVSQPHFTKKGDTYFNGSFSFGNAQGQGTPSKNRGYDAQAAYAFTNHFAASFSYRNRREADRWNGNFLGLRQEPFGYSLVSYQRQGWNAAVGYFTPVRSNTFNVYGGFGNTALTWSDRGNTDSLLYERNFSATVKNFFIQPGITRQLGSASSFSFSIRLNAFWVNDAITNYLPEELYRLLLDNVTSGYSFAGAEPSVAWQIGVPRVSWLKFEPALSFFIGSQNVSRGYNVSFGLSVDPLKIGRK